MTGMTIPQFTTQFQIPTFNFDLFWKSKPTLKSCLEDKNLQNIDEDKLN
jgi:hypothetical protein